MGMALTALALIALGSRQGLVALLFAAALIAACDAWIVIAQSGVGKGAKHIVYFFGLAAFGAWTILSQQ